MALATRRRASDHHGRAGQTSDYLLPTARNQDRTQATPTSDEDRMGGGLLPVALMTTVPFATARMSEESNALHTTKRDAVTTLAGNVKMSKQALGAIAWRFLRSEFTGQLCAASPIDL